MVVTSLVSLVTRDELLKWSVFAKENCCSFANSALRISAPTPWPHRAENMGVSRETYLRRERIWAVVGAIIAVAIVAFATWYNLDLRPTLDTWA